MTELSFPHRQTQRSKGNLSVRRHFADRLFPEKKDVSQSLPLVLGTRRRTCFGQDALFHHFHFEEINRLRAGIGRDPLPEDMLVWSSCCLRNQGYTVLSYAVNLSTAMVHTLIGECVQLDDCGTANTVCVFGEPHDKRTNV